MTKVSKPDDKISTSSSFFTCQPPFFAAILYLILVIDLSPGDVTAARLLYEHDDQKSSGRASATVHIFSKGGNSICLCFGGDWTHSEADENITFAAVEVARKHVPAEVGEPEATFSRVS